MTGRELYRRLLTYLRPYLWPHFTIAVVCMLIFSSTNGIMPFLVRGIFDDIFTGRDMVALMLLPGVIIIVFVVRGQAEMQRVTTITVGLALLLALALIGLVVRGPTPKPAKAVPSYQPMSASS